MNVNMKKRLSVFLSILFILPAIVAVLPMTALEAQAASYVGLSWQMQSYNYTGNTRTISVEVGQKFNIGDYAYVDDGIQSLGTASMLKATYSSSKKTVATVDSKGNLTAKKAGKATITVKYKSKKISCIVNVEKAGSFGNAETVASLESEVNELVKNIPTKITTKNGFTLNSKRTAYYYKLTDPSEDLYSKITFDGFLKDGWNTTNKLAVPQAGRYYYIKGLLDVYASKNSPTSTRSAKVMKIASVSGKTSGITIKVKKALTSEQILASQIESYAYNIDNTSQKKSYSDISVYDKSAKKYYTGTLTLTKGSKTVKLQLGTYKYSNGVSKYVKVKPVKGHTYVIGEKRYNWANGKSVKVK